MSWWDYVKDAGKWIENQVDNGTGNGRATPQQGQTDQNGFGGQLQGQGQLQRPVTPNPDGSLTDANGDGFINNIDAGIRRKDEQRGVPISLGYTIPIQKSQPTPGQPGTSPGAVHLPYFQQDRDRLQQLEQGQSPFASQDWGGLISELSQRAQGNGPSLAQQNYQMASGDTINALSSMARGSASPDAARQAMIQQGRVGQGQAAGLALAGTQERAAAQQGLTEALGTRDKINTTAYTSLLQQQLGLSDEELKALMGNAGFYTQNRGIDQQNDAAKYQAAASAAAIAAKLYGNS
jgi:hypothetical protein